jgi:hypothetical protein
MFVLGFGDCWSCYIVRLGVWSGAGSGIAKLRSGGASGQFIGRQPEKSRRMTITGAGHCFLTEHERRVEHE